MDREPFGGFLSMPTTPDPREVRGKTKADKGNQVNKVNDHSFKVKSQSGKGVYILRYTYKGFERGSTDDNTII